MWGEIFIHKFYPTKKLKTVDEYSVSVKLLLSHNGKTSKQKGQENPSSNRAAATATCLTIRFGLLVGFCSGFGFGFGFRLGLGFGLGLRLGHLGQGLNDRRLQSFTTDLALLVFASLHAGRGLAVDNPVGGSVTRCVHIRVNVSVTAVASMGGEALVSASRSSDNEF